MKHIYLQFDRVNATSTTRRNIPQIKKKWQDLQCALKKRNARGEWRWSRRKGGSFPDEPLKPLNSDPGDNSQRGNSGSHRRIGYM